ncbi:hypothetical protein D3C81_1263810 [compost metagenome]
MNPRPRIAISACLTGEPVRFNGGSKTSHLCLDLLAGHFDFVPVCPEVAIGLGTPRPAIHLRELHGKTHAVSSHAPHADVSQPLREYAAQQARELGDICGYIFMQRSPSCGLQRVRLHDDNGRLIEASARGLYAEAFCATRPELPVEEEGRLHDPLLRENFVTRVFACADWQTLCRTGLDRGAIIDFHSRYKYQLLAHNPWQYTELGRLLANIGEHDPRDFAPRYFAALMRALQTCATRGTHSNVLQHLAGYLKRALPAADQSELQALIDRYRSGSVPLVVPLTLLKHHFLRHPHPYIARQTYLRPHPEELGLRNAI